MMLARDILAEIVRKDVDVSDASQRLSSLSGFDSLAMVRLMLRLESEIDRELTEDEIANLVTIADVAAVLEKR